MCGLSMTTMWIHSTEHRSLQSIFNHFCFICLNLLGKHVAKKNKRKSSTPKTTKKHRDKKRPVEGDKEMSGTRSSTGDAAVRIPESQLVHLLPPSSKSGKVAYRRQAATSVFVPIYLTTGSRNKNYKCSKCPAEFWSKEERQSHSAMHKRDVKCPLCGKVFYTLEGLHRHQERESHSHPCDQCGQVFPLEILLKKHVPSHAVDRAFICDVCEKGYPSEASLQTHKRNVHATEKKHKCPECGKAFVRKDKMKRHELIHFPDTRPTFPCPFRAHLGCTKTFYREDKLKRHLFTHSDVKPYKCDICEKTFARRDNLTDHMRIHTGIFGNPCHICKKGYQGPNRLKRHLKSAHGIEPVESLPTMVPRESNMETPTVDLLPLAGKGNPSTSDEHGWEEDASQGFSSSPEFGSGEEGDDSDHAAQLPSIAKLASGILPSTRANLRMVVSNPMCAISEGLRVSSEALSMIGNVDNNLSSS